MATEYDKQAKEEFDTFVHLAIEGAKTLMHMAHSIEADIQYRMVAKNKGMQPALTFKQEDENVSPTIYIKSFFDRYKSGEDIGTIVKDIADAGYQGMQHKIELPVITPDEARRCIRLDLVGVAGNEKFLENVPHYIIGAGEGALAAYPRWQMSSQASFKVTAEIAANLQMTPSEVLALASENSNSMEYKIDSIGSVLRGLVQDMGTVSAEMDQMLMDTDPSPQMLVLTTPDCVHGASAMLSQDAMEQAQKMLHCEQLFVIPSSIHECLIVADNGDIQPETLKEMITEINQVELDPQDVLSDYPLRYSNGKLSIAISDPKIEMDTDTGIKIERSMKMAM